MVLFASFEKEVARVDVALSVEPESVEPRAVPPGNLGG
jgi:hypothetical protein